MLDSTPAQAVALQASQRSEPAAVSRASSSRLTAAWPSTQAVSTGPVLPASLARTQWASMVSMALAASPVQMPQAARAQASQAWPAFRSAQAVLPLVARACPSQSTAVRQSAVPARMPVDSKPWSRESRGATPVAY
jgi:hypothetical protein